jgi:dephospho-CoA kinase
MVGNGIFRLTLVSLPPAMQTEENAEELRRVFKKDYREHQTDATVPYPGILELLEELKAKNWPMAVLSNKDHENTVEVIDHFFPNTFKAVLGASSNRPHKPDPQGALEAAKLLAREPNEIFYLGDSDVDMILATKAGFIPVGVSWGFRSPELIKKAGAQIIIDAPSDFIEFAMGYEAPLGTPKLPSLTPRSEPSPPPNWAVDPEGFLKSSPGRLRVAVTGGIASGKSTLCEFLVAFGAKLIDFDILAREALAPETQGYEACLKIFGPKAKLEGQKALDRKYIAKKIFASEELRKELELIIHPYTWMRMLDELSSLGEAPLVLIDIPLLFEVNLFSLFNPIILCYLSPKKQISRLMERDGMGHKAAKSILSNQWPIREKLRLANYIINNDGSITHLILQAKKLYDRLTGK